MSNTTQDKKVLIPDLRFPEFLNDGEWEERQLIEVADRVTKKNKEGIITSVFTNSALHGIIDQREYFEKDIADKGNLDNYYIVEDGDFVYNPRISTEAPVGPTSRNNTGKTGAMSPLYTVFRFKTNHNRFFEYYFISNHWYKSIRKESNTGARFDRISITDSVLMGIPVLFPSPKEQQKIASCLSSLDELITAQTKKLEALQAHKKGLMQNLFPQEGQKVPNYRFPEFEEDGEWEEKKLGDKDVSLFVSEKINSEELTLENYISTDNMLADYSGIVSASKLPTLGRVTKFIEGDILISNIRPYLKKVWKSNKKGGASNDVLVFRAGSKVNSEFLEFILKNDDFIKYVMEGAKGVKMPRGDKHSMMEYSIRIPKPKEQQKIATCLSSVDELITKQQQKIVQLQLHKKGLMQGLFPTISNS